MAINKITDPSALPTTTADYEAQNDHINNHTLNLTPPFPVDFDNDNVLKGSVFNIGGDLFYTAADTAITGTASDYVKLTPGASTAVPTYETAANVTSNVAWSDAYNGYYDSSGNLYLFNEAKAFVKQVITTLKRNSLLEIGAGISRQSYAFMGESSAISGLSLISLAALDYKTVALIDGGNDELSTYSWSGSTWSLTGSALSISDVDGNSITALDSTTIAMIDAGNDELRTYSWSGSAWSLTGSALSVSVGLPSITALDDTTIALIDSTNKDLSTYSWSGSAWSLVGSTLSVTGSAFSIAALDDSTIAFLSDVALRTYSWSGSAWSALGTATSVSITTPNVSAFNSTDIVCCDGTNKELRTYTWNGDYWRGVGSGLLFADLSQIALSVMDATTVASVNIPPSTIQMYKTVIGFYL